MLIVIITIIGLILGIVGIIACCNSWFDIDWEDILGGISTGVVIVVGFALFVETIMVACVQIPAKHDYEKVLMEKEMLEYRLENDSLGVGNELLYNDIVEFNKELKDVKYHANNPWTNWFVNGYIAEIDYIEVKENNSGNAK